MTKETFIQACLQFIGIPYIWGGDDPMRGFDCSGLAQELLAMIGLDPKGDQTAHALFEHFRVNAAVGKTPTAGSLVFYGSPTRVTHVGVMIDEKHMIEAGGGGSSTSSVEKAIAQNAYIRIRPIKNRTDLVAVVTPKGLPW